MRNRSIMFAAAFLGLSVLAACSTTPPVVPVATAANTTSDGLVRVENSRFDEVYVRPGFDLSVYHSVTLETVGVSYKNPRERNQLTQRQTELMETYFREALEEAIDQSEGYSLTDTVGPGVLAVTAAIVDLEVTVPTDQPAFGRTRVFVASSGEISLRAELRDSVSEELLMRLYDRKKAQEYWHRATTVSEWSEVRSAFQYWASLARRRLDEIYAGKL